MSLTILIVEDEEPARNNIGEYLTTKGYEAIGVETLEEARKCIDRNEADVILLDVNLPDGFGPVLLEETAYLTVRPPIIIITGSDDIDIAVDAMKNGALDFLQKPIDFEQLEASVLCASDSVTMRRELAHLRQTQRDKYDFVMGNSEEMEKIYDHAQRAAETAVSVLITGETGTGKEILARAIHTMGPRSDKRFMGISCAAIQDTVLESELFGHEVGAFTGANKRKIGYMEFADNGILFLDEISSMSPEMQAKLLRALAERSFYRMGGTTLIHVDVQIIAASNQDLTALMEEKAFREDLYYRLNVIELHMPPLRERKDEIPGLVGFFISKKNPIMGKNIQDVTPRAMEALVSYSWPGNIRHLFNFIERAMTFCDDASIDITHLPEEVVRAAPVMLPQL